jgi:hypothetical protein
MARLRSHLPAILTTLFFVTVFLVFFNGYKQRGPSRRKFQKLPGGTEDVAADEIKPEGEDKLALELAANKRIKKWVRDWQRCMPEFDIRAMDDVGEAEIDYEPVKMALVKEERKGPGKMFYVGRSGKSINPWWKRLVYKKEESGWQPYIELPCFALLLSKKGANIVLNCTIFEGIQDAIWLDKNRVALLGYESVSRQMDVACKTVETCSAPAIWVLDFAKGWSHSYRGKIVTRDYCDVETYLKKRLPGFFGKEEK